MTQPKTLTTTETLEYIRVRTGRDTTPHKNTLSYYRQAGRITPHATTVGGRYENSYLLADVQLLCERINDGFWRKKGQEGRVYPKG